MGSVTRRRFVRDLAVGGLSLGLLPLLAACGQPRPEPSPARVGARVPIDGTPTGSLVVSPTASAWPTSANPWITPAPTPPAYVTPFPSGISTRPISTQPPTPASQVIPTSAPLILSPTKQASDPYSLFITGSGSLGVGLGTRLSELIVRGTVLEVLPARWSTPNGMRPPNPHEKPAPASIFRPVAFQAAQFLKGQYAGSLLYLQAGGGMIGQDALVYGGDLERLFSFSVGEQCVLFLSAVRATGGYIVPQVNNQSVLNVDEHFTIGPDSQVTNGYERMSLQQLLDKITTQLNTPGATATPNAP